MLGEQNTKYYWDGSKSITKFTENDKLIVIIIYKYGAKTSLIELQSGYKERNDG